jgi:putative transcriptional regulator
MDNFKTTVRQLRAELGLTQEELAEKVGIARQTVLYLEKGEYMPSLALAHRISTLFGKPIEDIFIFGE